MERATIRGGTPAKPVVERLCAGTSGRSITSERFGAGRVTSVGRSLCSVGSSGPAACRSGSAARWGEGAWVNPRLVAGTSADGALRPRPSWEGSGRRGVLSVRWWVAFCSSDVLRPGSSKATGGRGWSPTGRRWLLLGRGRSPAADRVAAGRMGGPAGPTVACPERPRWPASRWIPVAGSRVSVAPVVVPDDRPALRGSGARSRLSAVADPVGGGVFADAAGARSAVPSPAATATAPSVEPSRSSGRRSAAGPGSNLVRGRDRNRCSPDPARPVIRARNPVMSEPFPGTWPVGPARAPAPPVRSSRRPGQVWPP